MGRTVTESAIGKRVSEKTIRAVYWKLREALLFAVLDAPRSFGGAGSFLLQGRCLSKTGGAFLSVTASSNLFAGQMKRHCPRLKSLRQYKLILFEIVVRIFCHISMPGLQKPSKPGVDKPLSGITAREELLRLQVQTSEHRFPNDVLYRHLRRHLLKYPL